jgi:hypothetical protein
MAIRSIGAFYQAEGEASRLPSAVTRGDGSAADELAAHGAHRIEHRVVAVRRDG